MIVSELIEFLSTANPEAEVLTMCEDTGQLFAAATAFPADSLAAVVIDLVLVGQINNDGEMELQGEVESVDDDANELVDEY